MSKIKRIIEIEEKDYDQICEVVNETESSLGITPFAGSIIAQSKPYDDSGDLISRELLKKDIDAQISYFNELNKKGEPYKEFKDIRAILFGLFIGKTIIDNAPTVEPRIEYGTDGQPYKLSMTNGKEYERPQGEWKTTVHGLRAYNVCNKCNTEYPFDLTQDWILCPVCGADMRKGGAE